jgi:hypothetical protein
MYFQEMQKTRKTTTVEFTGPAKDAKDKLSPAYGIKNMVSAGILLVDGLPSDVRETPRVTNSTFMQRIGSIGSAKTLLQHSSSRTTGEFYTYEEVVLRWKVNHIPIREWLK